MAVFYWDKVNDSNIKYQCKYKIPILVEEILFTLTYVNEQKYLKNSIV